MVPDSRQNSERNPSQNSENYSVDEMMARLKSNNHQKRQPSSGDSPDSEGELVTRADGSQVMKVRRRKRRSKQPEKKKEPKTNPKIKWAIIGTFFGSIILLIVACVVIIAKYNGRTFKEKTEATIADLTGASTTEVNQLRVTPVSAKASEVKLQWPEAGFLRSITLKNLKADIKATSFLSSSWHGTEISASSAVVQIGTPSPQTENATSGVENPYRFGSYRSNDTDIIFGTEKNAPKIIGARASLSQLADESYLLSFQKGQLAIPHWPELTLASGVLKPGRTDCELKARLAKESALTGELNLTGNIHRNSSRPVVLDVTAKDYAIDELLGKLGRLVKGKVNSDMGSLTYSYNKPSAEALSFIMPFNSSEMHLEGFRFLSILKNVTGDTKYVRPIIDDARGTLVRTSAGVTINDIRFSNTASLNIKGHIQVSTSGKLSGKLTVGIHQSAFSTTPPAAFTGPHDGLYHTVVTLSGTIHNPHDDLGDRVAKHSGRATTPSTKPTVPSSPTPLNPKEQGERDFNDLNR